MNHYYPISNEGSKILSYLFSSCGKLMKETYSCGTKTNNISSSLSELSIDLRFYKSFLNKLVSVEGIQLLVPQTIEKNE